MFTNLIAALVERARLFIILRLTGNAYETAKTALEADQTLTAEEDVAVDAEFDALATADGI